jgi:hypothetical protein
MRYLLLLIVLSTSLNSYARDYFPGKAVKLNGEEIEGLFQYPEHSKEFSVIYKLSEDGKVNSFLSDDLSMLFMDFGEYKAVYERIAVARVNVFSGKIKKKKKNLGV